ncbi:pyrroline-5-carboxylate reductase [Lebetimonas natsushimae]|uniref:Pyrroline-5-carboxylate reductase n=1 Tax=Lebetimonas natsushimae TaxID=1936991 RepID=A0A292YGJ4_9BACT|nr:pyrroline-5-carboxylate reductase [Lebetimonas natsushimae]GAX88113.1 pyrroline-5-carboxylate reductase [Lebetimonas natsushimae]
MLYIVGYGEMAKAILRGLKNGKWDMENVGVVGRNEEKLKNIEKEFNVKTFLLDGFDITDKEIILAVKPYALTEISMRIKGVANTLYSILAGKSLTEIEKYIKAKFYIRAMPNIAAAFSASTTAVTGDVEVKKRAEEIFSYIGDVVWVENDDEIDMATAIIGSGPAFLAIIAEAVSDGGVYIGLKREIANKLTKGLFKSFSKIDMNFSEIKDKVMSPKGTTAEGILEMEDNKARGTILKVIKKTYEKSKKL